VADLITLFTLASIGFFAALSIVLLSKYLAISRQFASSTEVARDLWSALETRLKKQDERILDIMVRLDVLQSSVLRSRKVSQAPETLAPRPSNELGLQQDNSRSEPAQGKVALERVEIEILKALKERPRTSVEIKNIIGKSREHTARLMKTLFDRGIVSRDDSTKPFVYQLTEQGMRYLGQA
jgi:predicted transcriptional regulator